ncbi:hypothetical protein QBC35DRAFT_472716 [Podospora australis]|uniref:Uncharacterized protein n=1 Tax=Podospora australis TaxID=1536484 RepID=A0AAN7AL64_9PEZI|nr:hypothetical protein QBC35DRAFT_472716 [Podospora australis]
MASMMMKPLGEFLAEIQEGPSSKTFLPKKTTALEAWTRSSNQTAISSGMAAAPRIPLGNPICFSLANVGTGDDLPSTIRKAASCHHRTSVVDGGYQPRKVFHDVLDKHRGSLLGNSGGTSLNVISQHLMQADQSCSTDAILGTIITSPCQTLKGGIGREALGTVSGVFAWPDRWLDFVEAAQQNHGQREYHMHLQRGPLGIMPYSQTKIDDEDWSDEDTS